MYLHLKRLLQERKISNRELGELLNLTEKTVYNKLHGNTEWTYQEVIKIKKFLFPEYDLEYLFKTDKSA